MADIRFEFPYRWGEIVGAPRQMMADLLEARDQAMEEFMHSFSCGSSSMAWEFPYRWEYILDQPIYEQISLVETRDSAMESAYADRTNCLVLVPFRAEQYLEALLAGESWAIATAEENDRAIERDLAHCVCGTLDFGSFGCGNFQLLTTGGNYINTVGSGFGDFTLDGDTETNPISPTRPDFFWSVQSGTVTGGTILFYKKVGATETLLASGAINGFTSVITVPNMTAGTEIIMRLNGLTFSSPDVEIRGGFDFFSFSPSFALHEWTHE